MKFLKKSRGSTRENYTRERSASNRVKISYKKIYYSKYSDELNSVGVVELHSGDHAFGWPGSHLMPKGNASIHKKHEPKKNLQKCVGL